MVVVYFRFYPGYVRLRALSPVRFPEGRAAIVLRGAFGLALKRVACRCPEGGKHRADCLYARWFEPTGSGKSEDGMADRPRPIVIRADLEGRSFQAGDEFDFRLHSFDLQQTRLDILKTTLEDMARHGIGPGRGKLELIRYDVSPNGPSSFPISWPFEPLRELEVEFRTPTELKWDGKILDQPEFPALIARTFGRLNALSELYGDGPLPLDGPQLIEDARQVEMIHGEVRHVEQNRRSSRTGQVHPTGGFVGKAVYRGEDLGVYARLLRIAGFAGVGRQTTMGKGGVWVSPEPNNREWLVADPLPQDFYERSTIQVARGLLGKILRHGECLARIVETEAYLGSYRGQVDHAAHSARGITDRTKVIYGPPGRAYVYLSYGIHECLNVVAEPEGVPGCVLIRALEPLDGRNTMRERRGEKIRDVDLTNGPGKLTQAMGITRQHYGVDFSKGPLVIYEPRESGRFRIGESPRIGISQCAEWPLRFFIEGNQYVSR